MSNEIKEYAIIGLLYLDKSTAYMWYGIAKELGVERKEFEQDWRSTLDSLVEQGLIKLEDEGEYSGDV